MKKKNGFTLVELLAVLIILIIILTMTMVITRSQIEKARKNAFLSEALTYGNAGYSKYSNDRAGKMYGALDDDIYHGSVANHVCFSVQAHLKDTYVKKSAADYRGSVDVCYGNGCTYTTKVWLTDGESFIDGEEDPSKSVNVKTSFSTPYYNSCGVEVTGIGGLSTPEAPSIIDFPFTGGEQRFIPAKTGRYKLEVWGAQGGNCKFKRGGYGSYAVVETTLYSDQMIYINVGGQPGDCDQTTQGGYNGGGNSGGYEGHTCYSSIHGAAGGGATHIATKSGELKTPINRDYLLVAIGGGSGAIYTTVTGGGTEVRDGFNAGGWSVNGSYANKENVNLYGQGFSGCEGAGAGYFGSDGSTSSHLSGGGSGYIANPSTTNKQMVCFDCTATSSDTNKKTVQLANVSEVPTANYTKQGNGYARITYLGD